MTDAEQWAEKILSRATNVHRSVYSGPATYQDWEYKAKVDANVAKRAAKPKQEAA